jgi:hypothetical protein
MQYQYRLHLKNEHIFVEIDGALWLIDTGSPMSFGGTVQFGAHVKTLSTTAMGGLLGGQLSPEYLTEETGVECAGLLGNDILCLYNLKLDFPNQVLELHDIQEGFFSDKACSFELVMGVPLLHCTVGGIESRLLVDTGATITYWQHPSLSQFPHIGTKQDFYPMLGSFETNIYTVDIDCCHWAKALKVGTLPDLLGMAVSMIADGILGNECIIDGVFLYGYSAQLCEWP